MCPTDVDVHGLQELLWGRVRTGSRAVCLQPDAVAHAWGEEGLNLKKIHTHTHNIKEKKQ